MNGHHRGTGTFSMTPDRINTNLGILRSSIKLDIPKLSASAGQLPDLKTRLENMEKEAKAKAEQQRKDDSEKLKKVLEEQNKSSASALAWLKSEPAITEKIDRALEEIRKKNAQPKKA